jgi:hypothetical protein
MTPRPAPEAPLITPPTPIEPQEHSMHGRFRSRSEQLLDAVLHEVRSRSSSGSRRHSRSPDHVKDVIAKLGLAAGTVGAEHIKPKSHSEEDVLQGVRVFLSGLQNIIKRRATSEGLGDCVDEIIEVRNSDTAIFYDPKLTQCMQVGDDAQSVHSFHPILEAETNPFDTSTDETAITDVAPGSPVQDPQTGRPTSRQERRNSEPKISVLSREESFGDFVMDVLFKKETGHGLPGRARLDTGMTRNAVSRSVADMLGYPIEEYKGDPAVVADGSIYYPIGQVTIPFSFMNVAAKTWYVEFIVFPEGSPFDVCLGRRFILLANLLKRNIEALPVEYRKLSPSKFLCTGQLERMLTQSLGEEHEMKHRTNQVGRDSKYTKEWEDSRYDDRRRIKPKDKESKKWY